MSEAESAVAQSMGDFQETNLHHLTDEELDARIAAAVAKANAQYAEQLAAVRAKLPVSQVPAHAGGPGVDNHRASWSQAEQEASQRGEDYEHWHI